MLTTESEKIVSSSTNDLESNQLVCRSDVSTTMAEPPTPQPMTALSNALRHSLCSHADYLYFSDTCLSKCVQELNHIQEQQVGLRDFLILVVFCFCSTG